MRDDYDDEEFEDEGGDYEDDEEYDEDEDDDEYDEDDEEYEVDEGRSFRPSGRTLKIVAAVSFIAALGVLAFFFFKPSKPGSQLVDEYGKIANTGAKVGSTGFEDRHKAVLDWVKQGYLPSSSEAFVTVEVTGPKGTTLSFEVQPHGLRVGSDSDYMEVPTDGPFSLAVCRVQGLELPTALIAKYTREQAFKTGGKVAFIAEPAIKGHLGQQSTQHLRQGIKFWKPQGPDGREMMSVEFIKARNELLKKWRAEHKISDDQLTSGYFKEVIQDPAQAKKGLLATYPGYLESIAPNGKAKVELLPAANHGTFYFDYSHLVRCMKPELTVNGKPMTLKEFYDSAELRKEFGLLLPLRDPPYDYPPPLKKWMEENGFK